MIEMAKMQIEEVEAKCQKQKKNLRFYLSQRSG